jgi:hypothetical protein
MVRMTGLVVGATDPLDNKLRLGNRNRGWVRVVADLGGNRVMAVNRFDLTVKRWLVAGMEIPVRIDPGRPTGFEIVWDDPEYRGASGGQRPDSCGSDQRAEDSPGGLTGSQRRGR